MSIYYGPSFAPGSGRTVEYFWNPSALANIIPGTTVGDGGTMTRGGAQAPFAIWANNGTVTGRYNLYLNHLAITMGNPVGAHQLASNFEAFISPVSGAAALAYTKAFETWQQYIYEVDAAFTAIPADTSKYNTTLLGWAYGSGPAGAWGALSKTCGIVILQTGNVAFARANGTTLIVDDLSDTGVNPLIYNKWALRFKRPTLVQAPTMDLFLNGINVRSYDISDPSFPQPVAAQSYLVKVFFAYGDTGTASQTGVAMAIKGGRVIAGPLDASVWNG